jgi:hypothetical protein
MTNGYEAPPWLNQLSVEAMRYFAWSITLKYGQAAIIDGDSVFAYTLKRDNRDSYIGKVALLVKKGVPAYSGLDAEHLTEHVFPRETQGSVNTWHFKPNDTHRIIKIGDRVLRVAERPIGPHKDDLRISSPTPFYLDKMGERLRFSDLWDRLVA